MKSEELIHFILARHPGAVSPFLLCMITQGFAVDRALAPSGVILGKLLNPSVPQIFISTMGQMTHAFGRLKVESSQSLAQCLVCVGD